MILQFHFQSWEAMKPFLELYHYCQIGESDYLWHLLNPIVVKVGDIEDLCDQLKELDHERDRENRQNVLSGISWRIRELEEVSNLFLSLPIPNEEHIQ